MRIVVHMFLYFECFISLLQHHAYHYVKRFGCLSRFLVIFSIHVETGVISIFHPRSLIILIKVHIDTFLYKCIVQFFQSIELTRKVHHRAKLSFSVYHKQRRNAGGTSYIGIIRAKSRSYMNYTGSTLIYSHVISRYDTKCFFTCLVPFAFFIYFYRLHPRNKLFILHTHKVCSLIFTYYSVRDYLVAVLVLIQRHILALCIKMRRHECFGQYDSHFFAGIRVICPDSHIINLRAYAQCSIRWQCPWSGRPCNEIRSTPLCHFRLRLFNLELGSDSGILHIPITTGHIQFVRTQSRSGSRRIRLYGIPFIQQVLFIQLLQQPPKRFYISVVIGYIRIVHIHPITHFTGKVFPLLSIFHHLLTAGRVIIRHRNSLSYIFFSNAQRFFHSKFHRKSMRIPTGLPFHLKAFHRFVTAKYIFYRTCQYVMYSRHAIG